MIGSSISYDECKARRIQCVGAWQNQSSQKMDKATHAKITINDAGETEVRQLDVVSEMKPVGRHSILSIDISQAVRKIDEAERETGELRIAEETDRPRSA